jgi:hypothetical protein
LFQRDQECWRQEELFLPPACPAGSASHPAYGADPAKHAGAGVTTLKARFDVSMALTEQIDNRDNKTKRVGFKVLWRSDKPTQLRMPNLPEPEIATQ